MERAASVPRLRQVLKEGRNLREGLLSGMRFRLHRQRGVCGPRMEVDLTGALQGVSQVAVASVPGSSLWPGPARGTHWRFALEADRWPLCLGSKKKSTRTPKTTLQVSLRCPLLTKPKLHQLAKEKHHCQGPAAARQKEAKRDGSRADRQSTDNLHNRDLDTQ